MSFGVYQFRRGTAAQWTSANPVLAEGEFGLEKDTAQFKVGDGVTAWNSLGYGGLQGPAAPLATFTANGSMTAANKIALNTLDGRDSAGAVKRVFRPGDYMVGNTYDPTGATNSTSSFSAMMTAFNTFADRAVIELPPGVFQVDTAVIQGMSSAPGGIIGPGRGVCVLIPRQATGDMVKLNASVDGFLLKDFAIYQTGSPNTAGAAINTNGADSVTIENMLFVNQFVDVNVNASSIKCSIQRTVHSQANGSSTSVGVLIDNGLAGDTYVGPDVVMSNTGATRRRASVEVKESGHYEVTQANLTGSAQGILVDPAAGKIVAFGFHTNVLCDSCSVNGMTLSAATSTSTIKNIKSVNSWYSGTIAGGGAGVLTSGVAGGIINGVTFTTDRFLNNQTHGFQHGFGTDFRWSDCDMKGNSAVVGSPNTADGLNVAAGVSNWSVNGGKYGGSDTVPTATTQRYGINVLAGAGDNIKIAPDDLTGNSTGPLFMGATGANVHINGCPGLTPSTARATGLPLTIANTETVLVQVPVPKNSTRVGTCFRLKAGGMWINTAAATVSILRVRFGSVTLTGNVVAGMSINCGVTARASPGVPFMFDAMVSVINIGSGGTALGFTGIFLSNVVAPVITAPITAAAVVDSTADKLLEMTYISGLAGNSIVVSAASIMVEQY